ncbi:MAG: CAP domain-containing protein [Flavipsychrobacter sp.]
MYKNILIGALFATNFLSNSEEPSAFKTTLQHQKLLNMVNHARTKGCKCGETYYPPTTILSWNDSLAIAAQKQSNYMEQHKTLTHTGANNSDPGDRITATGYQWSTYGENAAVDYPNDEALIKGWLGSKGHCKNIMNPNFKEVGMGGSGAYWTQVFATKLNP